MEPIFEIRFYPTHRMIAEFYRQIVTAMRFSTVVLLGILIVGSSLLNACMGRFGAFELFLLTVYFAWLSSPHLMAWANLHAAKQNNDDVLPETRITVGQMLELDEGMVHLSAEYKKICRVVHLRHSYVLMLGKRNGLIIDPDGFTKGSFMDFKQFLREKRPDLRIPD